MQVILHEGDQTRRVNLLSDTAPAYKIIVPKKIFTKTENSWIAPVTHEKDLTYQFMFDDGKFSHYCLIEAA